MYVFPQNKMWTRLTREHVSTVFRSISDDFWPRELGGISADCVKWQWFSEVLLSPCGYVHHGSMTVSQTIVPEGSMITHIQQWFPPLAFTQRDFLTLWIFSQYYELWMVKDHHLQSCAKKHCLWTDCKFSHKVWHKVKHPPLQRLSLWWMLLLPVKLLIAASSRTVLLVTFFSHVLPLSQLFFERVAGVTFFFYIYLQNTIRFVCENTELLSVK